MELMHKELERNYNDHGVRRSERLKRIATRKKGESRSQQNGTPDDINDASSPDLIQVSPECMRSKKRKTKNSPYQSLHFLSSSSEMESEDSNFRNLTSKSKKVKNSGNRNQSSNEASKTPSVTNSIDPISCIAEFEDSASENSSKVKKKKPCKGKYNPLKWHPNLLVAWDQIEKDANRWNPKKAVQPPELTTKLLPFQLEALDWMQSQEEYITKGGILADEMGMGKTLEIISLLVSSPVKPVLIIVPSVALLQWKAELNLRVKPGVLEVLLYYGSNRTTNVAEIEKYDIVLTTYQILEQGFRAQHYGRVKQKQRIYPPSPLHQTIWARVILDEAHFIKDRYTSTARSTYSLKKKYRWCLTGTPLQNKIGELYSLIKFLDIYPYSIYFCRWCSCEFAKWCFSGSNYCSQCGHHVAGHSAWLNYEVIRLIQKYGAQDQGLHCFRRLKLILQTIMLRRTKLQRLEDLGLPPRIVETRRDYFNEPELELYKSFFSDCVRKYQNYIESDAVLNNYTSIFSLLSRMRLAVNHPDLVINKMPEIRTSEGTKYSLICSLCHDEAQDPIMSKCGHLFCRLEAQEYIKFVPSDSTITCPKCFKLFSIDLTQEALLTTSPHLKTQRNISKSCVDFIDLKSWRSSTKIEALVEELTNQQKSESTLKSIVFSQFVSFLDLVQWRLSRAGFNVVRLDGRMGPFERNVVISKFMNNPTVTVFLMSLKAGGVALNLTEASSVFIMDPWWNPAVENQAFDRIHRIGQNRPVVIKRLIIENSIESKILQLQEKKQAMFASTVGNDQEALERLTKEDIRFLFSN